MRKTLRGLTVALLAAAFGAAAEAPDGWPRWRGPDDDGMARGDAPLTWSDKDRIAWKVQVPGRGTSSPVIWGDRIFLTTAVPTGSASPAPAASPAQQAPGRGGFGSGGPQPEQRFTVSAGCPP